MNMPMDYVVFEPADENFAQLIVRILEERGYSAGYQLGYPHNKIFIKVDDKEEADKPIKPDNWIEKTHLRFLAENNAKAIAMSIFDIYKKSHGMASYT